MAKGIIVVDDIPVICAECNFANLTQDKKYFRCDVNGKIAYNAKPDWCPIKELPDKLELDRKNAHKDFDYVCEWNNCLYKIEREM